MATRNKSAKLKTASKALLVEVKNHVKSEGKVHSSSKHDGTIQPAQGKLGVMIPGMGAVATTFVAGVEAIRKGLAKPIGSLTQMGTVRLGKRTDGRSPKIKEFVPLAGLDDLVFTGWDIFEELQKNQRREPSDHNVVRFDGVLHRRRRNASVGEVVRESPARE
jgi:hypothetical protein